MISRIQQYQFYQLKSSFIVFRFIKVHDIINLSLQLDSHFFQSSKLIYLSFLLTDHLYLHKSLLNLLFRQHSLLNIFSPTLSNHLPLPIIHRPIHLFILLPMPHKLPTTSIFHYAKARTKIIFQRAIELITIRVKECPFPYFVEFVAFCELSLDDSLFFA